MSQQQSIPIIRLRLIYLTLLIAAFAMLIDFILFAYYLLSGELSMRFMLKVATCGVVAAGLYFYYKPELSKTEKKA